MKILLVEDNKTLAEYVITALESQKHVVDWVADGYKGLRQALMTSYDVILLDLYLPKRQGLGVAKGVRVRNKTVPIIMLTVEPSVEMKVKLLRYCDDYITKPFHTDELLARIRTVSRRGIPLHGEVLEYDDVRMDLESCRVKRAGIEIHLRAKEFALLEFFLRNPEKVFSRVDLLDRVWGIDTDPLTNTVDVHMRYLRKKLDEPFARKLLHTVSGRGYKLEVL